METEEQDCGIQEYSEIAATIFRKTDNHAERKV